VEKAEANIAVSSDSATARASAAQLIPQSALSQMMDEEEVKKELREAKEQLAFTQADDSDDDDSSDDEPRIKPVYRTQSGRGIRMRAAERACARLPRLPALCPQACPR